MDRLLYNIHCFTNEKFFKSLFFSLIFFLIVLCTPAIADDARLVGYWQFNEGVGSIIADSSGNANTGTVNGAMWIGSNMVPDASFSQNNLFWNNPQGQMYITNSFGRRDSSSWVSTYTMPAGTYSSKINVSGGSKINISGWMYSAGSLGRFGINEYDASGTNIRNSDVNNIGYSSAASWNFVSREITLLANTHKIDIRFVSSENSPPGGSAVYWDDINITVVDSTGKSGNALQFDGVNDYVRRSSGNNLPLGSSPRTFMAWIKPASYPDSTYNGIVAYGQGCTGQGSMLSIKNNGQLSAAFWCNDAYQTTGPAVTLNSWSHVAFTYDGRTTVKFYINGTFIQQNTIGVLNTVDGPLRIGCTDDPGRCFDGSIDEVRIYNRALYDFEIADIYNPSLKKSPLYITDAWRFAGYSLPVPSNNSWINATSAQKNAISYIDSNIWETKLTTGHDQFDYQMYRFYIAQPASEIMNLASTWVGYGENQTGYNTSLYIWDNSNNSWGQIDTKSLITEGTLNASITTKITDYVDINGYVYIAASAKHYDYLPTWVSHSVSGGILYASATDLDGNNLIEYNYSIDGGGNSGWTFATSWNSGLGAPGTPGCGQTNYYYYHVQARENGVTTSNDALTEGTYGGDCPPSCPLSYVWNGTGFEYSTDIAGASLGARTSVISYPRYYDMPDLKANNGSYKLLIREVLPEADYFDMAKLVVADVPDGYNIYTNWLGMKSFAVGWHDDNVNNIRSTYPTTPQLLTTNKSTERSPIHATNITEGDVTAQLQSIDNNPLLETAYGLEEYILDFGEINNPEYAKLIISAWVNYIPGRDVKLPVILSVINENGQWEQAAELGSFTGDLETRLYNISNIWITEDHRLKLRPSYSKTMTLVIDKVLIDDSKPVDVESTIVNISRANLNYRGNDKIVISTFEHRIHGDNVVEPVVTSNYFYGNFTKYGDVTPLLTQMDDKYAIMRYGDELSLSFDEVAQVNNKHRQYFLYAFDWYVTMTAIDTNRTFIRDTVDLLPFINMSIFPYNISVEDYPYDAEHNQYINDWNTRICNDRINGTCYNSTTDEQIINPKSENATEKPLPRSLNTNYVDLRLTFKPGYNVSGYVTDVSSSLAISGVLLQTNYGINTTTNSNGYYNFTLINSTYIINANVIGYDTNATTITVNGVDLTNVNISLVYHPYILSGYILNKSSGLPLSGVTVKVSNTNLNIITGADGFYNFTLIDGEYSIVAILQNYVINSTTATINGTNITNINILLNNTVPQGKDAWHSAGYNLQVPYSASWIPATLEQKNAILYNDLNIWETKLTTGHAQFDDQLYRFNVIQPRNEVNNLTVKWIGHGENKVGYDTYLYIWNFHEVSWELLDTKNLGFDGTLKSSITINSSNYIDIYGFVYIAASAKHYDYVPGSLWGVSLGGTFVGYPITCSWEPVIDLDGDLVQYFAVINGYNSGWINDTSFTSTAISGSNTCSVKTRDNFTYTESSPVSGSTYMSRCDECWCDEDYCYSLNTNYVELELGFNKGYNVSGYITDIASGLPLSGVLMQTNYGINTTTNSNGYYNFTLINSTYLINASKFGYDSNGQTITVNGGDLTNVNISLLYKLHTLSGYITDKSSSLPIGGVLVKTNTSMNTTSNSAGFYNFTVFNGTYIINASKIGYDPDATTVTVTGETTNVNIPLLYHPYNLSGYILNKSSGLPLGGVTVKVENTYLNMITGADGFYNFTLIDGEHSIVAILQNYAINSTTVTINGAHISNANISLINTAPQGKDAWHSAGYSLPVPYSSSWINANSAQKSAISYNDLNRWETKLTTGHAQFDDQLYRFNVLQPVNDVNNLTIKWIGHGENKAGYDTYIYIWNYSDVSWELLDTKNLGVDGTLTRSITINPGNYIDLYGFVYIAAGAKHYDYVPGSLWGVSLGGTFIGYPITCSWGPVIDLDGDLVQYFAVINGYNSGWINDTSFTSTAISGSNTCSVKTRDNFTYTESSPVSGNTYMSRCDECWCDEDYCYSLNTNYVEFKVNNQIIGNSIFNVNSTTLSSSYITWNNDIFSDNRVYYGLNETDVNNLVNGRWSVWNNNSMNPAIRLSGLLANTTYYYRPLTWYMGTVNNSVKARAFSTARAILVSPAEYMVSPAGWISSPENFRTINITAAPLDINGRYIHDLSLEAVVYNNSGVKVGSINLIGNGPYYANFLLNDSFSDERGYVTITNYSMGGEFSVLKWSCVNCHADGERFPSNFTSAVVHSRHTNTYHSDSCEGSCHDYDYNMLVGHASSSPNMNGCNGNSCHKSGLTCNECHNDVQNSADISNTSVLSVKYGEDVHLNKKSCPDCHGGLNSINPSPSCTTCHQNSPNLTIPSSLENKSHSNQQTVACRMCHNSEHDIKSLTMDATNCKSCHIGITHNNGEQCTDCHGSDPHNITMIGGSDCLGCHNSGGKAHHRVDESAINISIHRNLNPTLPADPNSKCWGCHDSNGNKPQDGMGDRYNTPYKCIDCHTSSGQKAGGYGAFIVDEHYPSGKDIKLLSGNDSLDACILCHNKTEMKVNYTSPDNLYTNYSVVSHYGKNRVDLHNTNETNCSYCHQNPSEFNDVFQNISRTQITHNNGKSCLLCHRSSGSLDGRIHDTSLLGGGGNDCISCHTSDVNISKFARHANVNTSDGIGNVTNNDCWTCHYQKDMDRNHVYLCESCHLNNSGIARVNDSSLIKGDLMHGMTNCKTCHAPNKYHLDGAVGPLGLVENILRKIP